MQNKALSIFALRLGDLLILIAIGRLELPNRFRKVLNSNNENNGGLAQLARALRWQCRGHRFESDILHVKASQKCEAFLISGCLENWKDHQLSPGTWIP